MARQGDQKDQIQQATDLVRLISEDIPVTPKGREYLAVCPFHDDHRPSMTISPQKQIYKCFSCGAGGDVFSWMMNYHKLSFPKALEALAERAGIELLRDENAAAGHDERQQVLDANELAQSFFRDCLLDKALGAGARDYLARRGISTAMQQQFMLGVAPDRWDALVEHARRRRKDPVGLVKAGLISPRRDGDGHVDRLRHRLIFPIHDPMGRVIAFGGRKLREEDEPKYLNSPETVVFHKSATLYGIHQARKAIMASRTAVMVEGYTDVIACHQAGHENVLATLGTAMTSEHMRLLQRFCEKVCLVFDGDEAGQRAADRAMDLFMASRLDVAVAILPGGMDPADLIAQEDGGQQWQTMLDRAVDALEFSFTRFRNQLDKAQGVSARERASEQFLDQMAGWGMDKLSPLRRGQIVQRLAGLLHVSEQEVDEMLRQRRNRQQQVQQRREQRVEQVAQAESDAGNVSEEMFEEPLAGTSQSGSRRTEAAERAIIGALLREPGLFTRALPDHRHLDEALVPDDMTGKISRLLYDRIYHYPGDHRELTLARFVAALASEPDATQTRAMIELATQCEMQVAQQTREDADQLHKLFLDSLQVMTQAQASGHYARDRQRILGSDAQRRTQEAGGSQEQDVGRLIEALRQRQPGPLPYRSKSRPTDTR